MQLIEQPDEGTILKIIAPKLYDPVRAVRLEAALTLAAVPLERIREDDRWALKKQLEEYRQAMEYNADFAPQRFNLGNLESVLGNTDKARKYYLEAIGIDDQFFHFSN